MIGPGTFRAQFVERTPPLGRRAAFLAAIGVNRLPIADIEQFAQEGLAIIALLQLQTDRPPSQIERNRVLTQAGMGFRLSQQSIRKL